MAVFLVVWLADKRKPSIVSSTFDTPVTRMSIHAQDTALVTRHALGQTLFLQTREEVGLEDLLIGMISNNKD